MSICGLDFTPFRSRESAVVASKLVEGSFGVTQLTNDSTWWYFLSKVDGVYKIHFRDGSFTIPSTAKNNTTFGVLFSRLSSNDIIEDDSAYIKEEDLINNYTDPVTVPPTRIIQDNKCNVDNV